MQQKRSRVVWLIAIVVAFFFFIDPFRLFTSNNMPQLRASSDIQNQMVDYLLAAPTPVDFVVGLAGEHDIVLVGETGFIRQQLEFVHQLIPALDRAGIHILGFQYANRADQERIDQLVTGLTFDESLARSILFNYQVILGYEEHMNVFRAAWQVNRSKTDGETPFRILALSTPPDYTAIVTQQDVEDPEKLKTVFANGVPDQIIAQTILEEVVQKGDRAVAYVQLQQSFTDYEQTEYTSRMAENGFPNQRRAGNILASELGDRVVTVVFHAPVQDTRSRTGYGYPLGGLIEKALKELPIDRRNRGFLIGVSPFADAPLTSNTLQEGRDEDLKFAEYADGYLVVSTIGDYEPVTALPEFITEENLAAAISQFPGPDPGDVGVAEMNEYIAGNAASMSRIFDEFDK